ncbi:autoinducer binding domain-containing protein [Mesorhizobium sp. M0615]|uniref:autoinducer binding domain-containing protein n=1 Tax=Mesorhizobium sp. M0615 TaxID=2956971 RepID=UPI0033379B0E
MSTYPQPWTSHYLHSQYEKMDPVIHRARGTQEPFSRDAHGADVELSTLQRQEARNSGFAAALRFQTMTAAVC